jgi:hypothetical protein
MTALCRFDPFGAASVNDRYLRIAAVHRAIFERRPAQARD